MKNLLILSVMLLGFWALYVAFHTPPAIASGPDFRKNCGRANIWFDLPCRAYVTGVVEGMSVAIHPAICLPADFDLRTSLPIVRHYLHDHPEEADIASPRIVQSAFRDAYPCLFHSTDRPAPASPGRDT